KHSEVQLAVPDLCPKALQSCGISANKLLSPMLLGKRWEPRSCPAAGIGKCVALDLARRNARTILACRSEEKGRAALEEIRRATGNPHVQLRILDTSSMASVRAFARRFQREERQLHILVNNAGASGLPHGVTSEGLERLFATNVLGPFLLTNLLLGKSQPSAPARIVNVSSFLHYYGEVNLRFLTGEERPKSRAEAYRSSKLMNVVFSAQLARRLRGTGELAPASHPQSR
uniref:RDH11 dehydrogenase n=1 Tax=Varanus komodoensis TaxID=61221 RepID=A0A8D2ILD4_VARKO